MFNRVKQYGARFQLGLLMNDIISFHITHPYTAVLQEISQIFINNQSLKILYKVNNKGTIRLVGQTDLGTTYEIILWTPLIEQWSKWFQQNQHIPLPAKMKELENILNKQKNIDQLKE